MITEPAIEGFGAVVGISRVVAKKKLLRDHENEFSGSNLTNAKQALDDKRPGT